VSARYFDSVYRFLFSQIGNREDAETLTSEAFLQATGQLKGHHVGANIEQRLFTIARTVLADHWRRYYPRRAMVPPRGSRKGELQQDPGKIVVCCFITPPPGIGEIILAPGVLPPQTRCQLPAIDGNHLRQLMRGIQISLLESEST
jgi:hypothetical protein